MRRRLGRAARAIATVAVLVAVVAVVGLAATGRISNLTAAVAGAAPTPTPETAEDRATTAVARRTLALTDEVDGTLGYRGEISILAMLDGTLTRQPDEGTVLERGDVVYEVDEIRRAVLMYGDRPAWRAMGPDMPNGADVRQLEENLNAFGFLEDYEVDRAWDDDTTDAVEDWQEATGKTDDGTIELGEIVFLPGPVRIAEMAVVLGQRVGGGQAVMDATSTTRVVTVALDAGRTDLVALDDAVTIELPDGTETAGTISSVGRVAHAAESTEPGDSSSPTIDVEITLDDPAESAAYDTAPVTVRVTRETRENVLAVPVQALVALLEGGYAVEIADDAGTHLVGVELGLFQDGWVEVRGDLAAGDTVVVPS